MGLTGRLCIRFQTITSEYDQGEPVAGAAGGKHCGDAGLAQCCQLPPAAQRARPLLRRKVQGDGDLQPGSAKLCDYKQANVSTAAHPVASVWRSIPVQPRVKKHL